VTGSSSTARLARFGLLLASLGLVAVVAEITIRATWKQPWWEQIRAEQTWGSEDADRARNEPTRFRVGPYDLPLRGAPAADPKSPATHRTLFLGDSFTYGLAVDPPATFVGRIEARLNETRPLPGIEHYEVYNGGIPGSLTPAWHALLAAFGRTYQPDLVVAVFFLRDGVAGVTTLGQIDAIRDQMQRLARESFAYRHSYLFRFVRARYEQRALSARYLARLRAGYLGSEAEQAEWWRARIELLWLRRESHRLGARFALVVFPMLYRLDDDYPLADVVDAVTGFAADEEIPVFSLLPAFRGLHAPDLWLSPFDQHPNARAHAIAAEALWPFIEQQIGAGRPGGGSG